MRRGLVALFAAVIVWCAPTAASAGASCEPAWFGDVRYAVDQEAELIRVDAVVWPEQEDGTTGCGDLFLDFPVVPGVDNVNVEAPVESSIEIAHFTEAGLSSAAMVAFGPGTLDALEGGVHVEYAMAADADWVDFGVHSARFPIWTIGEADRGRVSVISGESDAIVTTAEPIAGPAAVGSATFDPSRVLDWDAYATVYFGDYESVPLSSEATYFFDRSNPDPDFDVVAGSVTALEDLVDVLGPPPDGREQITIVEVPGGALAGYAGRYDPGAGLVEVDATVTQGTIIHELAHAWFNDAVFADPWVSEGLADFVSVTLEGRSPDTDGLSPVPAQPVTPSGGSLVTWDSVPIDDAATEAEVNYGYEASLWVMDRIAAEIGMTEFYDFVASTVADSSNRATPMTSQEFRAVLEAEYGFTDRDGVFGAFVLTGDSGLDRGGEGAGITLQPVPSGSEEPAEPMDSDGGSTGGFGFVELGLLATGSAAVLVAFAVGRSVRHVPLGRERGCPTDWGRSDDRDPGFVSTTDSDWAF